MLKIEILLGVCLIAAVAGLPTWMIQTTVNTRYDSFEAQLESSNRNLIELEKLMAELEKLKPILAESQEEAEQASAQFGFSHFNTGTYLGQFTASTTSTLTFTTLPNPMAIINGPFGEGSERSMRVNLFGAEGKMLLAYSYDYDAATLFATVFGRADEPDTIFIKLEDGVELGKEIAADGNEYVYLKKVTHE